MVTLLWLRRLWPKILQRVAKQVLHHFCNHLQTPTWSNCGPWWLQCGDWNWPHMFWECRREFWFLVSEWQLSSLTHYIYIYMFSGKPHHPRVVISVKEYLPSLLAVEWWPNAEGTWPHSDKWLLARPIQVLSCVPRSRSSCQQRPSSCHCNDASTAFCAHSS